MHQDPVLVGSDSSLTFRFGVDNVHLTNDAPSSWQLSASLSNGGFADELKSESILIRSGAFRSTNAEVCLTVAMPDLLSLVLTSDSNRGKLTDSLVIHLCWEAILYFCHSDSDICLMREVAVIQPLAINMKNSTSSNHSNVDVVFSVD